MDDPDDEAAGGDIIVTYTKPIFFDGIRFFDIEEGASVDVTYANGGTITYNVAKVGNGGARDWFLYKGGVTKMAFHLKGSGAVDYPCYCPEG